MNRPASDPTSLAIKMEAAIMIRTVLLAVLLSIAPCASTAVCLVEPLSQQLQASNIVFIATLVDSKISGPVGGLQNGKDYRIDFAFAVHERIKGDPASITSIYTINMYRDPSAYISWDSAEESRLVPGDNVLVLTNGFEDVRVSQCSPSRRWNGDTKELQEFRLRQNE